jgi:hypothetical protein
MKKTTKATGKMMGFRVPPALRASIVRWAETQPDDPSLSTVVRRLVEIGLTVKSRSRPTRSPKVEKANEMASRQLDRLADETATPQEQANRKRQLLGGPKEFESSRVDRRKKAKLPARP